MNIVVTIALISLIASLASCSHKIPYGVVIHTCGNIKTANVPKKV